MSAEKLIISWQDFHQDSINLANKLLDLPPFEGILAVARGGLMPATIIANHLNIRLIDTICAVSYDKRQQGNIHFIKQPDHDCENWLIIEDLVDTGNTVEALAIEYPKATFACLYAKPQGQKHIDYFVKAVETNQWIELPWETEQ